MNTHFVCQHILAKNKVYINITCLISKNSKNIHERYIILSYKTYICKLIITRPTDFKYKNVEKVRF